MITITAVNMVTPGDSPISDNQYTIKHIMFIIRVISLIIIVLISYIFLSKQITMASECTKNGRICSAWYMRGLVTAKPFLRHLMSKSDIIAVSEHMLYDCEL